MKALFLALALSLTSVQAKSLPELKFNLFDLSSENPSGFFHAVIFPEFFAAHVSAYVSHGNSISDDNEHSVAFWYAVTSLAGVAALSPEAAAVSVFSAGIEGAGYAFDKEMLKQAADVVKNESQAYYATGEVSVALDSMIHVMNKIAGEEFDQAEAIDRLVTVANSVAK